MEKTFLIVIICLALLAIGAGAGYIFGSGRSALEKKVQGLEKSVLVDYFHVVLKGEITEISADSLVLSKDKAFLAVKIASSVTFFRTIKGQQDARYERTDSSGIKKGDKVAVYAKIGKDGSLAAYHIYNLASPDQY